MHCGASMRGMVGLFLNAKDAKGSQWTQKESKNDKNNKSGKLQRMQERSLCQVQSTASNW
jgi:hypothetical protein